MLTFLSQVFQQECYLNPDLPVLVGVSGGADSLCLLDVCHRLGYKLMAAHFDHGMRPDSNLEARLVAEMCESWGIPIVIGEGAVPEYAQLNNLSLEEAARVLRYQFLYEQGRIHQVQAVAVAHHADDQVETVLMHMLRGSGLDGLKGMSYRYLPNPWSDTLPLVRPLLSTWRAEIEVYCAEGAINPIQDPTNMDITYFRNRIRHKLIPVLEEMAPGARQRLWQTADVLKGDHILLEERVDEIWARLESQNGPGYTCFNHPEFQQQSIGYQRRLIRRAVSELRPGARDVDYALVQRVLDFSRQATRTGQADIGLGLRVFEENERLYLADWDVDLDTSDWPQILRAESLSIPGELVLGHGWVLQAEVLEEPERAKRKATHNRDPYQAWVDIGESPGPLTVRQRTAGELFRPLGMGEKKMKLSDFMINVKIPRRAREHWPLVCLDREILWVPGYRLGHPYRLTGATTQVVHFTLEQLRA